MQTLIALAIQANLDLEIALARVQEARMMEAVATGGALPAVGASASAGAGTGHDRTSSRVAPPLSSAVDSQGLRHVRQAAGLDASWEIDLFGRLRREIEAAHYDAQAAIAARNGVLITVTADVARAYLEMRGLQMRLAVARQHRYGAADGGRCADAL